MGSAKDMLEAAETDYNSEMRLCASCGEEADDDGHSWEYHRRGRLTTVWVCVDCMPNLPEDEDDPENDIPDACVSCEVQPPADGVPLCVGCMTDYQTKIDERYRDATCWRCASEIPLSEWSVYESTGLCGYCEHMRGSYDRDDRRLYSSEVAFPGPPDTRIITPEEFRRFGLDVPIDPRIITHLDKNFDDIFRLSPRQFEELVAELMKSFGYRVNLGPRGRDGGVDVYAERDLDCGPELVLVQCKHYGPGHKVTEPVIKQLWADVQMRQATRGMAVTTSTFTSTALKCIDRFKYQLAGTDHVKLKEWFQKAGPRS